MRGLTAAARSALVLLAVTPAVAQENPVDFLRRLVQPPVDAINEALRPPTKPPAPIGARPRHADPVPLPHLRPGVPTVTASVTVPLPQPAPAQQPKTQEPKPAVAAAPPVPAPEPSKQTAVPAAPEKAAAASVKEDAAKTVPPSDVAAAPVSSAPAGDVADSMPPVPHPHLRPAQASGPQIAALPPPIALDEPPPAARSTCGVALASLGVMATALAPIHENECGIATPVEVSSLEDGAVDLSGKAIVDCHVAETLADWVKQTVQPEAEKVLGGKVTGLRIVDAYSCRTRDNIPGEQLSEHAKGNAIDIAAFKVKGRWIEVGKAWGKGGSDSEFLTEVRTSACGPFKTVLGPGSDSFHTDHFHLDLEKRRSGATYCH
jgi:hypothetical protein